MALDSYRNPKHNRIKRNTLYVTVKHYEKMKHVTVLLSSDGVIIIVAGNERSLAIFIELCVNTEDSDTVETRRGRASFLQTGICFHNYPRMGYYQEVASLTNF